MDGVVAGYAPLSSGGVATFSLSMGLSGGSHSLQAVYLGTTSFAGSTSAVLPLSVSTAATTTTLTITPPYVSPNSALPGNSVTLIAGSVEGVRSAQGRMRTARVDKYDLCAPLPMIASVR